MQSPDPEYARKKGRRDRSDRQVRLIARAQERPDWAVSFQDETCRLPGSRRSRVRPPAVSAWAEAGQPPQLVVQAVPAGEPKVLACYGLLWPGEHNASWAQDEVWLRFVDGRPLSGVTTAFLGWCCERLAARGVRVWVLVWDNAA